MTFRRGKAARVVFGMLALAVLTVSVPAARGEMTPLAYCTFRVDFCPFPSLELRADGATEPKALPPHERVPVAVRMRGEIITADATHPPALRTVVVDLDRNVEIDAAGFPDDSVVGRGTAKVALVSGGPPKQIPVTILNRGVVDGVTRLAIETSGIGPVVAGARVKQVRKGRYGHEVTWNLPPLLNGAASLVEFDFRFKRGYVRARCTDGKLQANITEARFINEGEGPRTVTTLKSTAIRPCTPKSRPG